MTTPSGTQAPVAEGDILASKYRVEKVLGVGGMGVVVAAHHLELDQRVALKFLLPQAASNEELVERFLREARASVRLKGAHVAKTLDVGRLEDNCPYIVMEYLEGSDLHAELRSNNGVLPVEIAVSYVLQAAEGLAEAHSRGIVHRDLKPGNLFLTRGVDGRPLVKVLDFGISKTLDSGIGGEGLSLTRTEMLLGSPLYMSPEQMRSSKHIDERSDLWALGAIAYELLTGKVPFEADSILELCFKVAQEKAPSPKTHRPELADGLCAAVLRCLEKDPDLRFQNVGDLARSFEPFGLARDRGTAERALDVLGTGKRPPRVGLETPTTAETVLPGTPLPAAIPVPAVPERIEAPPVAPLDPVPPSAAWGTTQAQTSPRSRKPLFAIAAAVLAVAAVGGIAATRKTETPTVTGLVPSMPSAAAEAHAQAKADARAKVEADERAKAEAEKQAEADKAETEAAAKRADAGPQGPPVALAAVKAAAGRVPVVVRPAASASAKPGKPAAAAPTTDPGGFIKVRE